ncbi:MAG: AAA family ATPase, partial [Bacteroidia bacterium]
MSLKFIEILQEEKNQCKYQIRNIGGSDVYYKKCGKGNWLFIDELEFIKNSKKSNIVGWEKPKEKKSLAEMRNDVHAIFAEIDTMVGLKSVRRVLEKIVAQQWAADILKQRYPDRKIVFSKHLVFTGAPGTGKTTMARYVGRLYAAINVLPSHKFVEVSSADLIAQYVWQTAPRVRA